MKDTFSLLAARGYTTLPIAPKEKFPATFFNDEWRPMYNWMRYFHTPPTQRNLDMWQSWPDVGIGIPAGHVCPVDLDTLHPALAKATRDLAYKILGFSPYIRIGEAPKAILLYRLENPIPKMYSTKFSLDDTINRIEILGQGQQFVAFGIHPKTNKPYSWPEKSPLDINVNELPLTTPAKLNEFISAFEFTAEAYGAMPVTKATDTGEHTAGILPDGRGLAASAVKALTQEMADDYETWIKIGMALKSAMPEDEGQALDLWHAFSEKSDKYEPALADKKWDSFQPDRIGAGTLYRFAQQAGWSEQPDAVAPEDEFRPVELPEGTQNSKGTVVPSSANKGEWLIDFEADSLPPRPWLLGRHLLRGQVTTLVAPGGVGKSTLALAWAASIATKRDLCHATPHQTGKVWLVNNEDDAVELKRRFAAVRQQFGLSWDDLRGRIRITGAGAGWKIAKRTGDGISASPNLQSVIDEIKREGIVLLIIDPLVSTHPAEENNNTEMEAVMSLYRRIAVETACAICLVHHTSKPPGGSAEGFAGNQHAGRGASAVVNAARVSLTLFDMPAQDAVKYNISDDLRGRYARLDDAKANLSLRSSNARWFYRESVHLSNGDEVGVLRPEQLIERTTAEAQQVAGALADFEELTKNGVVSLSQAAIYLRESLIFDHDISDSGARKRLQKILAVPVPVLGIGNFSVWYEHDDNTKGRGKGAHFVRYGVV